MGAGISQCPWPTGRESSGPPFPKGGSPPCRPWGSRCMTKGGGARTHRLTTSPPAPCSSWLVQTAGSPGSPLCQSASCRRTVRAQQLQRPPVPADLTPPGGREQYRGREWTQGPGLRAAGPPEAGKDAWETGEQQVQASTLGVGGSLDATHSAQPARVSKGHGLFGAGTFRGPGPPRGRQKRLLWDLSSALRPR